MRLLQRAVVEVLKFYRRVMHNFEKKNVCMVQKSPVP